MRPFPVVQFTLHQAADGALHLQVSGTRSHATLTREALLALFGPDQPLDVSFVHDFGGKVLQYTSEVRGAEP